MILQELVRLCDSEGLLEDADYEWRKVAWIVDIDLDGNILGITGTHFIREETKKQDIKQYKVPRSRGKRTSGIAPEFLVDNSCYLFGLCGEKRGDKLERVRQMHETMLEDISRCAAATDSPAVRAQLRCMERIGTNPQSLFAMWTVGDKPQMSLHYNGQTYDAPAEWTDGDSWLFSIGGDHAVFEYPEVVQWWAEQRNIPLEGDGHPRCLVTGNPCVPVDKHPPLQVPGATTSGAPLISINSSAFESYGFSGNANAPISREAAEKYGTALRRLLARNGWPKAEGGIYPRGNIILPSEVTVLFWTTNESVMELIFGACDGQAQAVEGLFRSVWNGKPIRLDDDEAFYTISLSGANGRIILRDAVCTTVQRVCDNFRAHFSDLRIAPQYADEVPRLSLYDMLAAIKAPGETAGAPKWLVTGLFHSMITGDDYPLALLEQVIARIRANSKNKGDKSAVTTTRASLIKAVLNRKHRNAAKRNKTSAIIGFKPLGEKMNDDAEKPLEYLLGCLFAVLEKVQQDAIKSKSNLSDGYLGGACASPALVFPRLLKLHEHHIKKLSQPTEKRSAEQARSLAKYYKQMIDALFNPLPIKFPKTLLLEQQGVFFIGYHQQRAKLWTKKEKDKAAKEANEIIAEEEPDE